MPRLLEDGGEQLLDIPGSTTSRLKAQGLWIVGFHSNLDSTFSSFVVSGMVFNPLNLSFLNCYVELKQRVSRQVLNEIIYINRCLALCLAHGSTQYILVSKWFLQSSRQFEMFISHLRSQPQ